MRTGWRRSAPQAKLIHQWPFEEDPSVTTTVTDTIGGLNGSAEGPASAAGKAGKAFSFDGTNDRVQVQDFVAPLQGTIALWLNPNLAKSKERFLGTGGDFEVWLRNNGELKNELFDNGSTTLGTGAGRPQSQAVAPRGRHVGQCGQNRGDLCERRR